MDRRGGTGTEDQSFHCKEMGNKTEWRQRTRWDAALHRDDGEQQGLEKTRILMTRPAGGAETPTSLCRATLRRVTCKKKRKPGQEGTRKVPKAVALGENQLKFKEEGAR